MWIHIDNFRAYAKVIQMYIVQTRNSSLLQNGFQNIETLSSPYIKIEGRSLYIKSTKAKTRDARLHKYIRTTLTIIASKHKLY